MHSRVKSQPRQRHKQRQLHPHTAKCHRLGDINSTSLINQSHDVHHDHKSRLLDQQQRYMPPGRRPSLSAASLVPISSRANIRDLSEITNNETDDIDIQTSRTASPPPFRKPRHFHLTPLHQLLYIQSRGLKITWRPAPGADPRVVAPEQSNEFINSNTVPPYSTVHPSTNSMSSPNGYAGVHAPIPNDTINNPFTPGTIDFERMAKDQLYPPITTEMHRRRARKRYERETGRNFPTPEETRRQMIDSPDQRDALLRQAVSDVLVPEDLMPKGPSQPLPPPNTPILTPAERQRIAEENVDIHHHRKHSSLPGLDTQPVPNFPKEPPTNYERWQTFKKDGKSYNVDKMFDIGKIIQPPPKRPEMDLDFDEETLYNQSAAMRYLRKQREEERRQIDISLRKTEGDHRRLQQMVSKLNPMAQAAIAKQWEKNVEEINRKQLEAEAEYEAAKQTQAEKIKQKVLYGRAFEETPQPEPTPQVSQPGFLSYEDVYGKIKEDANLNKSKFAEVLDDDSLFDPEEDWRARYAKARTLLNRGMSDDEDEVRAKRQRTKQQEFKAKREMDQMRRSMQREFEEYDRPARMAVERSGSRKKTQPDGADGKDLDISDDGDKSYESSFYESGDEEEKFDSPLDLKVPIIDRIPLYTAYHNTIYENEDVIAAVKDSFKPLRDAILAILTKEHRNRQKLHRIALQNDPDYKDLDIHQDYPEKRHFNIDYDLKSPLNYKLFKYDRKQFEKDYYQYLEADEIHRFGRYIIDPAETHEDRRKMTFNHTNHYLFNLELMALIIARKIQATSALQLRFKRSKYLDHDLSASDSDQDKPDFAKSDKFDKNYIDRFDEKLNESIGYEKSKDLMKEFKQHTKYDPDEDEKESLKKRRQHENKRIVIDTGNSNPFVDIHSENESDMSDSETELSEQTQDETKNQSVKTSTIKRPKPKQDNKDGDAELSEISEDVDEIYSTKRAKRRINELIESNIDQLNDLDLEDPKDQLTRLRILNAIQQIVQQEANAKAQRVLHKKTRKFIKKSSLFGPGDPFYEEYVSKHDKNNIIPPDDSDEEEKRLKKKKKAKKDGQIDEDEKTKVEQKLTSVQDKLKSLKDEYTSIVDNAIKSADDLLKNAEARKKARKEKRLAKKKKEKKDPYDRGWKPGDDGDDDDDDDGDDADSDISEDDERTMRLLYGNRLDSKQYMISRSQSQVLYVTHKDDFFEGINPRTDYRPSESALRYTQQLQHIQREQELLQAENPKYIPFTVHDLIKTGKVKPPLLWFDDEYSSAALNQTYNNIRQFETYLHSLQPQFLPTCNVFAMHTLLTYDERMKHFEKPLPDEPPSPTSPLTILPQVYSPLDIKYRPLFADFLLAMRFELKVRNNIPFASQEQRLEEQRVFHRHSFKVEYNAYRSVYQQKLREQIIAKPTCAFLWDTNEFTLQVSYNALLKQKHQLVHEHNVLAKRLGEKLLNELDTDAIEAYCMKDEDYSSSVRLFRVYRGHFEKYEEYMKTSAIGHKHTIIRQQAEFNQYMQWFSEADNFNPYYTKFYAQEQERRENAKREHIERRLKLQQLRQKAMATHGDVADMDISHDVADLKDEVKTLEVKTIPKDRNDLRREHQVTVIHNLKFLPGHDDSIVSPKLTKVRLSKEDRALEILKDTSIPLIQRQQLYLNRIAEIKKKRQLKRQKRSVKNKFKQVFNKLFDKDGLQPDQDDKELDELLDSSDEDREKDQTSNDTLNVVVDENGNVITEQQIFDDFFPGLREFVVNDVELKHNNLVSLPEMILEKTNSEYLKQYKYLAQQATRNNGQSDKQYGEDEQNFENNVIDYDGTEARINQKYEDGDYSGLSPNDRQKLKEIEAREVEKSSAPQEKIKDDGDFSDDSPDPSAVDGTQPELLQKQRLLAGNNTTPLGHEGGDDVLGQTTQLIQQSHDRYSQIPEHLRQDKDNDLKFTQQLYPNEHFDDEFISNVRRRLRFEEQERFRIVNTARTSHRQRKYERQLRRYVQKKYPNLRDPQQIQERVEDEKRFDERQSEIFQSLERQLYKAVQGNMGDSLDYHQTAKKLQMQKLLSVTNKEVDLLNQREKALLDDVRGVKDKFLHEIENIYQRNLEQLHDNLRLRTKYEQQHIVQQFNGRLYPFVRRYKELNSRLLAVERRVLEKHYNTLRFQQLYENDASVHFDHDPMFQKLQNTLQNDTNTRLSDFRPQFRQTGRTVETEVPDTDAPPIGTDLDGAPIYPTKVVTEYKRLTQNDQLFEHVTNGAVPDFQGYETQLQGVLKDPRGFHHANEAMQALYRGLPMKFTKLHAYYAFLGYDPQEKSIDAIIHHLSELFGEDTMAKAVQYSKQLATDEVVIKLNRVRPRHELLIKLTALEKEIKELSVLLNTMNPGLFKREGQRVDNWSFFTNVLPYINYRARHYELRELLDKKNDERMILQRYIQQEGLETVPLSTPYFDDFKTLFDAFSLAEQRKVRTFLHPYRRDGIFGVVPLDDQFPKRRIAFAQNQSELPDGYILQDMVQNQRDWDDFVHQRDQLFLDIKTTTATMKELEAQLRHYIQAVLTPTLEHFIDVFLSSGTAQSTLLRRAVDLEAESLNVEALRDYKRQQLMKYRAENASYSRLIQDTANNPSQPPTNPTGVDMWEHTGKKTQEQLMLEQFQNKQAEDHSSQQWRSDHALRTMLWEADQDLGKNAIVPYDEYKPEPPGAKDAEQFRRWSFSKLFLPHHMDQREAFLTRDQRQMKDIAEHEMKKVKHRSLLVRLFTGDDKTKPDPKDYKTVAEQEFDEYLRIQQHLYNDEDKLKALRDKDFVIQNAQAMRRELLQCDADLDQLYVTIQTTLPKSFSINYQPLDINLTYSKLEILLDVPMVRRTTAHGVTAWDDQRLNESDNLSQGQIDRILADPFLNIDMVNDTIAKYVSMGKVVSKQEEQRRIRKAVLEEDILMDELNKISEGALALSGDTRDGLVPTKHLDSEIDDPTLTAIINRNSELSRQLFQHQALLEQQQMQLLQHQYRGDSQSEYTPEQREQQVAMLQQQEDSIRQQVQQKFPTLNIPTIISEYNNKLSELVSAMQHDEEERQIVTEEAKRTGNLSLLKQLDGYDLHQTNKMREIKAKLLEFSQLDPDRPLTKDDEYDIYRQMLQHTREELDRVYQKQFPHLSKLDRLKLMPVNIPQRLKFQIPKQHRIYDKLLEQHQYTLWSYLQHRNRAMALIEDKLTTILPPFQTKADVRLHMISQPDFISRDAVPHDPTIELEKLVNHINDIPKQIEAINERMKYLQQTTPFITFQKRVKILEEALTKKYADDPVVHQQKLQQAFKELHGIKPREVREYEALPVRLETLASELGDPKTKRKIQELTAQRDRFLDVISRYNEQEKTRLNLEHLAMEYHSVKTMIINEYILQLNQLFEQSLINQDKHFINLYQRSRQDFDRITQYLHHNIKDLRGFYDKMEILNSTKQWCVNQTYTGPIIKKFLRHPEVRIEYEMKKKRDKQLRRMKKYAEHKEKKLQLVEDEVNTNPYFKPTAPVKFPLPSELDQSGEKQKENDIDDEYSDLDSDDDETARLIKYAESVSKLGFHDSMQEQRERKIKEKMKDILKDRKKKDRAQLDSDAEIDLLWREKKAGDHNSDSDDEAWLHELAKNVPTTDHVIEDSPFDALRNAQESQQHFNQQDEMDKLFRELIGSADNVDRQLIEQIERESKLNIQYVDEEPPLDKNGQPLKYVVLPHRGRKPGIVEDKSMYVQLKQHNTIARLLNAQYDIIEQSPDGEAKLVEDDIDKEQQLQQEQKQWLSSHPNNPLKKIKNIFVGSKKAEHTANVTETGLVPASGAPKLPIRRRIPLFSIDELLVAKKLDRLQSSIDTFIQFNVQYCYPDAIAARRRVFDPNTNTAYLITNPQLDDKEKVKTLQERGITNAPTTTTDLLNVLNGEAKVFTDLVTTSLVDLEDRETIPKMKSTVREHFESAMEHYNDHMRRFGKPPDDVDETALNFAKKWLYGGSTTLHENKELEGSTGEIDNAIKLNDRYRRTTFNKDRYDYVKIEYFDWRRIVDDLNLRVMTDYEHLQYKQYKIDLYQAECEEAIDFYRKLKLHPHLREAIVEEMAGFSPPDTLDGSMMRNVEQSLRDPVTGQYSTSPLNIAEPTSSYSTHHITHPFRGSQSSIENPLSYSHSTNPNADNRQFPQLPALSQLNHHAQQIQLQQDYQQHNNQLDYTSPMSMPPNHPMNQRPLPSQDDGQNIDGFQLYQQQRGNLSWAPHPATIPGVTIIDTHLLPTEEDLANANRLPPKNPLPQLQHPLPKQHSNPEKRFLDHPTVINPHLFSQTELQREQQHIPPPNQQFVSVAQHQVELETPKTGFYQRIRDAFMKNRYTPMTTKQSGSSLLHAFFKPSNDDDVIVDAQTTGIDLYHPHTHAWKTEMPPISPDFHGAWKETRQFLKSNQIDRWAEFQPGKTSTFYDYLQYVIQSRKWNKSTVYQGYQVYRDQIASRRERKIHELMHKQLKRDLERLRAEQGGLDSIILYNYRLKKRREITEELKQFQEKKEAPPTTPLTYRNAPLRSLQFKATPQLEIDLRQREDMEVAVFNQHLDSLSQPEKLELVDDLLKTEFNQIEVDDEYYKDWAEFPPLETYKEIYSKFYNDDPHATQIREEYLKNNPMTRYFGQRLAELDKIYAQYKEEASQHRKLLEMTEQEYKFKIEQLLAQRDLKQKAANLYFLQQQNTAFLHTPMGLEVYQKRQTRRIADPEAMIEREQEQIRRRMKQQLDSAAMPGDVDAYSPIHDPDMPSSVSAMSPIPDSMEFANGSVTDRVQQQLVDRGKKYFNQFDFDDMSYPTPVKSFTDFLDIKARMRLGTTMYGSVVQTPAAHQYHDSLDPSPLPKEAAPPHFRDYNTMHPDRLGYFITYYDAYRMKMPAESPFREYNIERPDVFQYLSIYPTYTLDGNYVHTPTKDPYEWSKDPSRPDLLGQKFAKPKIYYLYWGLYGLLRPSVMIYSFTGVWALSHAYLQLHHGAPADSELLDFSQDYSLAQNTYVPTFNF